MSERSVTLRLHLERARAAGAEAEFLPADAWLGRLKELVRETGARIVALPAAGWPAGVREAVEGALLELGCAVVAPAPRDKGYQWDREALATADLGITWCSGFIAETGSVALPAGPGAGTAASLLPFVHLAVGRSESVYADFTAYLSEFRARLPSRLTLVTGPSRTGDIEGTMNTGVHGPGRMIQWLLEDSG